MYAFSESKALQERNKNANYRWLNLSLKILPHIKVQVPVIIKLPYYLKTLHVLNFCNALWRVEKKWNRKKWMGLGTG